MRTLSLQELRKTESSLRTERDQWRDQATANKHEVEKLRGIFNWTVVFGVSENLFFFMGPVHTMPKEFEKQRFHSKNASINLKLKTQQSPVILDLCLRKIRSWKSHDYLDAFVFKKHSFQNVFSPRYNAKSSFSNSFGLKSVFEKLRFCEGLD